MGLVAVSVGSQTCKTAGCGGEAMHARGPYAGLCLACTGIQRRRLSAAAREGAAKMTPEARSARAAAGGRATAAGSVVVGAVRDVLRDIERALLDLEKTRSAEAKAMKAARSARDARNAAEQRVAEARAALDSVIGTAAGAPS